MYRSLIAFTLVLLSLLLLSCAKAPDNLPLGLSDGSIFSIKQVFHAVGNAVDFEIYSQTLFVAEDIVGFSVYDLTTGDLIQRVSQVDDEGTARVVSPVRLIRYVPSCEALLAYNGSTVFIFLYNEDDANLSFKAPPVTGRTNNIRDMILESLPNDTQNFRTFWGYYGSPVNTLQMGRYTNVNVSPGHEVLIQHNIPNAITSLVKHGNDLLVATMGERGVGVFHRTENTISLVTFCNTPGSAQAIKIKGDIAYIADRSGGLQIIDISYINEPQPLGDGITLEGNAMTLDVCENYLAVGTNSAGLYLYDISDGLNPRFIDRMHFDSIGEIYKVFFYENNLFVASRVLGVVRIEIKR